MKPVIGVMGGGDEDPTALELAERVGELIADRGWILLNGGRPAGVMQASTRGAKRAGGTVIGVLPTRDKGSAAAGVDVAIVTGMGDGRNVINVLSSDVVIALPGGMGTVSEVALAIKTGRPVILLGLEVDGPPFARAESSGLLYRSETAEAAVERAASLI